jgi:pyridoxal phosphate enzyme (YggS family)
MTTRTTSTSHPSCADAAIDAHQVAANLAELRARIRAAGGSDEIEVVAVTKGFGPDAVAAASGAGCRLIGENYAQELLTKRTALLDAGVSVHFIGRLQSNKVRLVADLVSVWETVDRSSLVAELARRAPGATVLIQVDPTSAPDKGGCAPEDVADLVAAARSSGLLVDGLMTVGPTAGGPEAARLGFRAVRRLVDELGLATCSMGMTDDLEVAVEEGSTRVRVGTALFGPRP